MYAGGISYLSSGSAKRPSGGRVCPEAVASEFSELRQINRLMVDIEDLIIGLP
jgi:hypothetical protein